MIKAQWYLCEGTISGKSEDQSQAQGTCSHSDLYQNLNIWLLVKYTSRLPDILGCFVFNVSFIDIDYLYSRIRYLLILTLLDDFVI